MYVGLRGSLGPPPIGVRYRCSQFMHDAMRWVPMHNLFLSGIDFWRHLDKAYSSVPGSGGSNPLHAIPCVHGLTKPAPPRPILQPLALPLCTCTRIHTCKYMP
jgi:hypothetical protein